MEKIGQKKLKKIKVKVFRGIIGFCIIFEMKTIMMEYLN
jgi:hypothetical protein